MTYKPKILEDLNKGKIKIPIYIIFLVIILGIEWKLLTRLIIINIYALGNTLFFGEKLSIKKILKSIALINTFIFTIIGINYYVQNAIISTIIVHVMGVGLILYMQRQFIRKCWTDVKASLDPIKNARKHIKREEQ